MNLLGIYAVGVTRSLCRRLLLDNRKLSIVMALSTTFTQCAPGTTKFGKITQNKGHFAFKVTDFGTNRKLIYDFLSVINTNLGQPPILHCFGVIAFDMSEIAIFRYSSEWFPWDYLRKIFSKCQWMSSRSLKIVSYSTVSVLFMVANIVQCKPINICDIVLLDVIFWGRPIFIV